MPPDTLTDACHATAELLTAAGQAIPPPTGPIVTASGGLLEVGCDALDEARKTLIYADMVTSEFCAKVKDIARGHGADPDWFMACMYFETGATYAPDKCSGGKLWGELEPDVRAKKAVGLIQWTNVAIKEHNRRNKKRVLTKEQIAAMTALEQLDLVQEYFARFRGRIKSLPDCYMAILAPFAIGKPLDFVIYTDTERAYVENAGLDGKAGQPKDGKITKREAVASVQRIYERGVAKRG